MVTTKRQQFKKMTISFEVPSRQYVGSTMISIVASGKESPIQMTYERSAMEACLLELERHGYLISNLSCSKSKRFNRINMILIVSVRALHKKICMTWYVNFVNLKNYDTFFDCAKQFIIFVFHFHCRICLVTP